MKTTRSLRQMARNHIIGAPNEDSRDENMLYLDILGTMLKNPSSPYFFYFNTPITTFGVPSQSLRIRDCQEEYLDFAMNRCKVERREALELLNLVGHEPVRTNALLLDVGKVHNKKLVMALELNRNQHYEVPENGDERANFARVLFRDMLKERELRKISEMLEVNYCRRNNGSANTEECLQINHILYDFVHNV